MREACPGVALKTRCARSPASSIFSRRIRAALQRILAATRLKPGDIVPNNSHFDTTRANIEYVGAQAIDLLTPEGQDVYSERRFKGNMDIGSRGDDRDERRKEYSFLHDYGDK